ncbi:MAG TPA: hypothetical protein VFI31_03755 [Pirellulales bacterium]|nr:hypothetical protein [Pirellulales bacterium]
MPQTRDIALEQLTAADEALGAIGMRVDPAHSLGAALVGLLPLTEMPVGRAINDLVQGQGDSLRRSSIQPPTSLSNRERELQAHEAYIDARRADLQREVQDARRWLRERSAKLDERETRLNELDAEVSAREAALSERVVVLTKPAGEPAPSIATEHPAEADRQARVQDLAHAREQLARRRALLEEFWRESSRSHQRAQELRLLAEELVAELRNSLDVDRARQAVTAIRQRLAQHPRTEEPRLTDPRGEFQWLKNDLAAEDERLARQYEELTGR